MYMHNAHLKPITQKENTFPNVGTYYFPLLMTNLSKITVIIKCHHKISQRLSFLIESLTITHQTEESLRISALCSVVLL